MFSSPNLENGPVAVAFNHVLGVTADGVPVMCNGTERERRSEEALRYVHHPESLTPALRPLSSVWDAAGGSTPALPPCHVTASPRGDAVPPPAAFPVLGTKWESVELARRYLAARKGVWLAAATPNAPPSALWQPSTFKFVSLGRGLGLESRTAGEPQAAIYHANGEATVPPAPGDLLVWGESKTHPTGHVAVVVGREDEAVFIIEQDNGCVRWPRYQPYSRKVPLKHTTTSPTPMDLPHTNSEPGDGDGEVRWRVEAEAGLLGWVSMPTVPLLDPSKTDVGDDFRLVIGHGRIFRRPVSPALSLPWTDPFVSSEQPEYYLRQSLLNASTNQAKETDVPSGIYYLDYNAWCRLRNGANSLHALAMEATARILSDPDATYVLEHYFGIPSSLHACLRRSWATTPALGGRFDFGYDGSAIKLMEYNCDSSGALLECCETQEKMARYYGMEEGESTGAWLSSALVEYFRTLREGNTIAPSHGLIHFFIDEDNEERYTAMTVMRAAEAAGFRTKLSGMPHRFHFTPKDHHLSPRSRAIYDEDGERIEMVWKTWSWDTVLHQYEAEQGEQCNKGSEEEEAKGGVAPVPTLSHILLNDHIIVFEPFWKAVTGSKAILPYMYDLAPDHELLLPCSFVLTREIASEPYISKPVNGRAGQNISMFDPKATTTTTTPSPSNEGGEGEQQPSPASHTSPLTFSSSSSSSSSVVSIASSVDPSDNEEEDEEDRSAENSPGRFYNSVVVYQQRLFLKKFSQKYFPIFCGWMIDDRFAGIVVREDQSKITTLDSLVAPARVIRDDMTFRELEHKYNSD